MTKYQPLSLTKPSTNVVGPPATPADFCFPCNVRYNYSGIGGLSGLFVVDGVTLLNGYRVFVVDALNAVNSGIYSANAGVWYRSQDMIVGDDAAADRFSVTQGTVYSNTNWVCTNSVGNGIVGTNPLFFDPYSLGSPAYIVATGGTVTDVNIGGILYRLHTFTSSGTFTVTQVGTSNAVTYLVVAGGGGGGIFGGAGGGGGGGVRSSSSTVNVGSYPVVVGAGGALGTAPTNGRGTSGTNSSWNGIVSIGGGGGAGANNFPPPAIAALSGGSGGGGSRLATAAGAGTAGQGFAGGAAIVFSASNAPGGGGGGAGGVGGSPTGVPAQGAGGVGGVGLQLSITGTPTYYGGGGGGAFYQFGVNPVSFAAGGLGGGGIGGFSTSTQTFRGTAGTNGLGGGCGALAPAVATGGSGVVIIRYQIG